MTAADASPSDGAVVENAAGRPGRPRDADLDTRILDATLDLLAERGYEHTTMDDVAQRAGVAKATVYRRYASKDELAVDAVKGIFDSEIPTPDTGSFRGDLDQMYSRALTFAATPRGQALLRLSVLESGREPRVAALYREWLTVREERTDRLFDRAVERGELRPDAPRKLLFEWVPAMLIMHAVMGYEPIDPATVSAWVDLALAGAAPREVENGGARAGDPAEERGGNGERR